MFYYLKIYTLKYIAPLMQSCSTG